MMDWYKDVTLLITHYNRATSLERLLASFKELQIAFAKIIVSDDASTAWHQEKLKALEKDYGLDIVWAAHNQGLGANLNKGIRRVGTEYILYIQEDFQIDPLFKTVLADSVKIMEEDKGLDLIRYFAHFRYPYLKPYKDEFEETAIPFFAKDFHKIYAYSDTPHLKRRSFKDKFGEYREDLSSDQTEYRMCISFIVNEGRCLINKHFKTLFTHENLPEEPSTVHRRRYQHSSAFLLRIARYWYRQVKYNFDIWSTPAKKV
jgi:glycosyltransferase involved in cell wall biosynthesis